MGKSRRRRKNKLSQQQTGRSEFASTLLASKNVTDEHSSSLDILNTNMMIDNDKKSNAAKASSKRVRSQGSTGNGKSPAAVKALKLTKKQKRTNKQKAFLKKLPIDKKKEQRKSGDQLERMSDLDSCLSAIAKTKKKGLKPGKKLTNRQRRRQISEEVKNFCAVMEHPAFQTNPLDTITEHLNNSIAAQEAVENPKYDLDKDMVTA